MDVDLSGIIGQLPKLKLYLNSIIVDILANPENYKDASGQIIQTKVQEIAHDIDRKVYTMPR